MNTARTRGGPTHDRQHDRKEVEPHRARRRIRFLLTAALAIGVIASAAAGIAAPSSGKGDAAQAKRYAEKIEKAKERFERVVTQQERDIAASNLAKKIKALGLPADAGPAEYFAAMDMVMPGPGDVPDYSGMTPNWAYTPPLRKFVDGLPGLGAANANNLGQYLSVGKPDTTTYPGSDYYEIELREYTEQLHSDLPPTTLRGYVQVNKGTDGSGNNTLEPDPIHYLGPTIIASKDRPVRIKFTNKLPTGEAGDLFIPVDTTVMGAGMGPLMHDVPSMDQMYYTENRATLHLHGGRNPWISDGTPHQWITPAGENTPYPEGVSVREVPDMPGYDDPRDGTMTFYYSNAQSARLMFYHDHSYGITRLNVYAGEAAGYIIEDDTEKQLVADGTIPAEQIPLIIQDKTFVDAGTIGMTDPTWNWGTGTPSAEGTRAPVTGDLWMAHVYMPNQNPYDISGYNAMGRWHYGPWFWPPVVAEQGPIPNPYYVSPTETPGQPPEIPGVPHPSMGMESFFDTPLVNGTAYPVLEVDPKAYRFRVLNASNDRFWNLQLYEADPAAPTEVRMVPAEAAVVGAYEGWQADGRDGGLPDPTLVGPDMVQIANEGGFLPSPVVLKSRPISWNLDVTNFNVGNVDGGTLMLGPAERADIIVDFSAYAGKTLILYNDAPAPWPAVDPRYDYYTGNPDLTDAGGHASTLPGYGPNTRTVMQVKVAAAAPAPAYDLAALEAAFAPTDGSLGVFRSSQDDVIVAQEPYGPAYNTTFSGVWPDWGIVRIFDKVLNFKTVDGSAVSLPLEAKAIQDEMGETFDLHYGRMAGKLGLELPNTIAGTQNFMLYGYDAPPTEIVESSVKTSKIGELGDGTQIWKITQNGVDTHPMHFHLFEVQLLNRVAWDGKIVLPWPNELGWKDTVKVNPLEDTIVALRPVVPDAPWDLPNSVRMLDPTMPEGAILHGNIFDPLANPVNPVRNHLVNFGWEYVWHCHILSHEEMDMMRPMSVVVAPKAPSGLAFTRTGGPVNLTWTDNSLNETGFVIERATDAAFTANKVTIEVAENATSYTDAAAVATQAYYYRIFAKNLVGDMFDYTVNNPQSVGFPTKTAVSANSPVLAVPVAVTSPTVTRLQGADRYATAVAVAGAAFPSWTGVTDVVIVSGANANQVDALAASGLAGAYNAPLLLTEPNRLTAVTRAALVAMPDGLNVHIVGGAPAVSNAVQTALTGVPGVASVDRISGPNRYATAAAVATRMKAVLGAAFPTSALIVNGSSVGNLPDGITAGPVAAKAHLPILLVASNSVPGETSVAIGALGITRPYIIGSTTAVSAGVAATLGVPAGDRLAGANRYATAVAVANRAKAEGWLTFANVGVTGAVIDGLSGGAALGHLGGPVLWTATNSLPGETRAFLVANKNEIQRTYIFGSTSVVSAGVMTAIINALQ